MDILTIGGSKYNEKLFLLSKNQHLYEKSDYPNHTGLNIFSVHVWLGFPSHITVG